MPLGKGDPAAQFQQDLFQEILSLPKIQQDALASDVLVVTESQNCRGWKGPSEVRSSSPTPQGSLPSLRGLGAILQGKSVFALHAPDGAVGAG